MLSLKSHYFVFALTCVGMLTTAANAETKDSEKIEWVRAYSSARRTGTDSSRPVLLFLTTDGCRHCVRMKHDSFSDPRVAKQVNESFVPAMLHLEADSELGQALKVTIYPTTIIIHPDGRIMDYVRGYISRDELRARMDLAVKDLALGAEKTATIASSR